MSRMSKTVLYTAISIIGLAAVAKGPVTRIRENSEYLSNQLILNGYPKDKLQLSTISKYCPKTPRKLEAKLDSLKDARIASMVNDSLHGSPEIKARILQYLGTLKTAIKK